MKNFGYDPTFTHKNIDGKNELFKGLFIYDKWDFEQFPVMYITRCLSIFPVAKWYILLLK